MALTYFDIRYPIVCAPMGGVAGGRLAAAVSKAGGLGMIGMGSAGSSEALQRELALVPQGIAIGIGLVDWVMRRSPDLLETAISAKPALLAVSFGEDFDWIDRAHDAGIRTAVQVHDIASAAHAHEAGADLLVARGLEGGGHGRPVRHRDQLLAEVLEATDRPVLAAGAIATAHDVEAALALGAAGVWVGTAFSACTEALSTPGHRRALFAASGEQTTLTSTFDWAGGYPWPAGIPERVISNRFLAALGSRPRPSTSGCESTRRSSRRGR